LTRASGHTLSLLRSKKREYQPTRKASNPFTSLQQKTRIIKGMKNQKTDNQHGRNLARATGRTLSLIRSKNEKTNQQERQATSPKIWQEPPAVPFHFFAAKNENNQRHKKTKTDNQHGQN